MIPARRNLLVLLCLGIWLTGWVTGELSALGDLLAGLAGGLIVFEREGETVRLGASLDPAEAQFIVERMRQRCAFPRPPAMHQPGTE